MNGDEKRIWESTVADVKDAPWPELGCCALGIIVMLGLNNLITSGIVNLRVYCYRRERATNIHSDAWLRSSYTISLRSSVS